MAHEMRRQPLTALAGIAFFAGCVAGLSAQPEATPVGVHTEPTRANARTTVVPMRKRYVLGRPMTFRVELDYIGKEQATYDTAGGDENFEVRGPDGRPLPYIAGTIQVMCDEHTIRPGEKVPLVGTDLSRKFYFSKPGRHTVKFKGDAGALPREGILSIPASDVVELDVEPGQVSPLYAMMGRLLGIVPERWWVAMGVEGEVTPTGRASGRGGTCALQFCPTGYLRDMAVIGLWQTEETVRLVPSATRLRRSDCLGHTQFGHVYISLPEKARKAWPEAEEVIARALGAE